MFSLFASVEKKMRVNAANWLELADKVYHYRRDELKESDRLKLQQQIESLRAMLRDKADASKLKLGIESLEGILRTTGGTFYPKSTIQEYVEFFLVAAIVVLGIRTYFIQPFKIPTNSMYPTYYGMTPEAYPDPSKAPGPLAQAVRFLMFGAVHKEVVAPADGQVLVPVGFDTIGNAHVVYGKVKGRKWLIIPADLREHVMLIGGKEVRFRVPLDFDSDWAFRDAYGLTQERFNELARNTKVYANGFALMALPVQAQRGKPVLSFDVLTGDQLFVDRVSYHFIKPKVGEGFVFRTTGIELIGADQYYIKRLVGTPGDTLEVKAPRLLRNGAPITGSPSFEKNANREGLYRGYANLWALERGRTVTLGPKQYYAMGDNSYNSSDSRYWGPVPEENIVGRPLFIYYPFTRRWGPAR